MRLTFWGTVTTTIFPLGSPAGSQGGFEAGSRKLAASIAGKTGCSGSTVNLRSNMKEITATCNPRGLNGYGGTTLPNWRSEASTQKGTNEVTSSLKRYSEHGQCKHR